MPALLHVKHAWVSWRADIVGLLALAMPLIAAQFAHVAMLFANTMVLGRLGTTALAGAALGTTSYYLLFSFANGVLSASSNLIAHAFGAGNTRDIGDHTRAGLILAVVIGALFNLLLWQAEPALTMLGQQAPTIASAMPFLHALQWGMVPGLMFMVLRGFMTGIARPGPIMRVTIAGVACNAALSFWFAFGGLGLPAYGGAGVGWANSITECLLFGALAWVAWRAHDYQDFGVFRQLTARWTAIAGVLRLGLPIGATFAAEQGLFSASILLIGRFGTESLAAHQLAMQAVNLAYVLPMGLSFAVSMRVGEAAGAARMQRARHLGRLGLGLGVLISGAIGLVFLAAPNLVVQLLAGEAQTARTVSLAVNFLMIGAVFELFDATQTVASGAIRGLKESAVTMWVSLTGYWLLGLPLGWLLSSRTSLGAVGVWWGMALGLASTATLLAAYFEWRTRHGPEISKAP